MRSVLLPSASVRSIRIIGLTTCKGAPDGRILKSDVVLSRTTLSKKDLSRLNYIVTMFIDYAELMAEDAISMSMADWLRATDNLNNNCRKVLQGKERSSHDDTVKKAENVYGLFRVQQDRKYCRNLIKKWQSI
ncbi:MAG: virulence RhuM family protein [Desulfovibrio sp.]|nr:virulence RhuM family protein [Desulfovibrio sp.]